MGGRAEESVSRCFEEGRRRRPGETIDLDEQREEVEEAAGSPGRLTVDRKGNQPFRFSFSTSQAAAAFPPPGAGRGPQRGGTSARSPPSGAGGRLWPDGSRGGWELLGPPVLGNTAPRPLVRWATRTRVRAVEHGDHLREQHRVDGRGAPGARRIAGFCWWRAMAGFGGGKKMDRPGACTVPLPPSPLPFAGHPRRVERRDPDHPRSLGHSVRSAKIDKTSLDAGVQ